MWIVLDMMFEIDAEDSLCNCCDSETDFEVE